MLPWDWFQVFWKKGPFLLSCGIIPTSSKCTNWLGSRQRRFQCPKNPTTCPTSICAIGQPWLNYLCIALYMNGKMWWDFPFTIFQSNRSINSPILSNHCFTSTTQIVFISCIGVIHGSPRTPLRMWWKKMFVTLFVASLPFNAHLMSLRLIMISYWPNAILTSNIQSSPLRFLAMSFHFGITLDRNQILVIKRKSCHKFITKWSWAQRRHNLNSKIWKNEVPEGAKHCISPRKCEDQVLEKV